MALIDPVVTPPRPVADTRSVVMPPDNARVFAAEFIGTAILILCGPGSAILVPDFPGKIILVALCFGLALLAMAYAIGHVSGCHINPAVTLGMWLARQIDGAGALVRWVAQFTGAIFGAAIIWGIQQGASTYTRGGFASNGWNRAFVDGGNTYGLGSVAVVEIVFTALLMFAVLSTTGRRFSPGFGGLVVGLTLTLIHLVTIPIDNTSVNPARSLATALFADTDPNALAQVWAFIVFPMIGAVVGVIAWVVVDEARFDDTRLDTDYLGGRPEGERPVDPRTNQLDSSPPVDPTIPTEEPLR